MNGKGVYQTAKPTLTYQTPETIQPLTTPSSFTMVGKGLTQTAPPTFTMVGKGVTQTTPKEPVYPEPEPIGLTPENGLYSAGSPPVSPEGSSPEQPLHESPDNDICE